MSVVRDYNRYFKYNLHRLAAPDGDTAVCMADPDSPSASTSAAVATVREDVPAPDPGSIAPKAAKATKAAKAAKAPAKAKGQAPAKAKGQGKKHAKSPAATPAPAPDATDGEDPGSTE